MTTLSEHSRRRVMRAKRKALIAMLICSVTATAIDANAEVAEMNEDNNIVEISPQTIKVPLVATEEPDSR